MKLFSVENEVALVTGASRGIGRAIAMQLGAHGATVVGTATTEAGAEVISKALAEAGNNGAGLMLNVTQPEQIEQVVKTVSERFGAPTILVNNAGITRDNLLTRMKD